jgi:HPt (histidine-containing phosphotransfer) domain-containing protein
MSTTSVQGPGPVYLDAPSALEQIGDMDALRNLLGMLREFLERDSPKIAQLLAADDVRGARAVLHAIKGMVPIFCTPAFCSHVTAVELLSKTGQAPEVSHAYAELQPKLTQLHADICEYLAANAGAG